MAFKSLGTSARFCTDPLAAISLSLSNGVQTPRLMRSLSKWLLMHTNSPANVLRTYTLDVYGSKHSLLPRICDVDAVGIGATNNELRTPWAAMRALSPFQSKRSLSAHSSFCSLS